MWIENQAKLEAAGNAVSFSVSEGNFLFFYFIIFLILFVATFWHWAYMMHWRVKLDDPAFSLKLFYAGVGRNEKAVHAWKDKHKHLVPVYFR